MKTRPVNYGRSAGRYFDLHSELYTENEKEINSTMFLMTTQYKTTLCCGLLEMLTISQQAPAELVE